MPSQAFDFGAAPSFVTTWNAWGGFYSNIPGTPLGRAMRNGDTRICPTGIVMYIGGNGGARTGTIYVGGASLPVSIPAANGSQAVGGACTVRNLVGGGGAGVQAGSFIDGNGAAYQGMNTVAGRTVYGRDGAVAASGRELAGYYDWAQSPSAPGTPSVTPNSGSQVTLNWAAPADSGVAPNGVGGIIDYYIEYGTSPTLAGASTTTSATTSKVITGLTPGATYYFRISARNETTNLAGTTGPVSGISSATLGTVPGAPTGGTVVTDDGVATFSWVAPASDGGIAITSYEVDYSTDAGFAGATTVTGLGSTVRSLTRTKLTPGSTYYFRARAVNSIGAGANSTAASGAIPARSALDIVKGAAVSVAGHHVSIRSDGANDPVLTLGYIPFGSGGAFTTIATIPDGVGAAQFAVSGGERNLALVADSTGNLYVIGLAGSNDNTMLVQRYERTGTTSWVLDGTLSQVLPATGDPLAQFAAVFVPGSPSTILVLVRRAGTVGAGALSYATLDLAAIEASAGSLFLNYGSDPTWLPTPPAAAAFNSGVLDATLVSGSRVAILGNGFAVVDVAGGAVTGVSKAANGTIVTGAWARVLGVNATTFVVLTIAAGALSWTFYGTNGSVLGSGSYAGSNAQGGAFGAQWDAFVDRVANAVVAYYIADDSARKLESIDISPVTYAATAAAVLSTTLGAASSTNPVLRLAEGTVDERRIVVETANLLAGAKSTASYNDLTGNVAPNAPSVGDLVGYDATAAQLFGWTFGDNNPLDAQTAYEFVVERVSDGVAIVSTGKVVSTDQTRNVAGAVLTNGVNYRWRVRTWDALDTQGAWSAYDAFTTAATGTLTITTPVADNPAGLDTSSLNIAWTYVQANGYVQTQRRVRVVRVSDSVVLSDTTMQASAVANYTVTALPTDVPVRIEVSIVTNAPGTPTIGPVNRLLTTSYGAPMTPAVSLTTGESYIEVSIANPTPSGSRPEVVTNIIERRETGSGDDFEPVAAVGYNGIYADHAVASGRQYDYRVRGVTA